MCVFESPPKGSGQAYAMASQHCCCLIRRGINNYFVLIVPLLIPRVQTKPPSRSRLCSAKEKGIVGDSVCRANIHNALQSSVHISLTHITCSFFFVFFCCNNIIIVRNRLCPAGHIFLSTRIACDINRALRV